LFDSVQQGFVNIDEFLTDLSKKFDRGVVQATSEVNSIPMNTDQLNRCLAQMDTLAEVTAQRNESTLILSVECWDGGAYENLVVQLICRDPVRFHLPFFAQGAMSVKLIKQAEHDRWISTTDMETHPQVLQLLISVESGDQTDLLTQPWYVCCHESDWLVQGPGARNNHELDEQWR